MVANNKLEKHLWDTADALRRDSGPQLLDYSFPAPGLVFLSCTDHPALHSPEAYLSKKTAPARRSPKLCRMGRKYMVLAQLLVLSLSFAYSGAGQAPADKPKTQSVSGGQAEISFVDDAENNAYEAAKREPDPGKRAVKLFDGKKRFR